MKAFGAIPTYPDDTLDDMRERFFYLAPPSGNELLPPDEVSGVAQFMSLYVWFDANTGSARDCMLIYLADEYGIAIDEAETLFEEYESSID